MATVTINSIRVNAACERRADTGVVETGFMMLTLFGFGFVRQRHQTNGGFARINGRKSACPNRVAVALSFHTFPMDYFFDA
jgi:hypothetical protein